MELHMIIIIYTALHTHRKDSIFMQRRLVQSFTYILEWGRGTYTVHWRSTHGAGHIPLWGIFIFWHACPVLTQSGNWVSKRKWVGGCGEYGIHWIGMNSNKLDKFTTQSHISQEPNNGRRLYISIYYLHTYMQVPARWIIKIWVTMLGAITV